MRLAWLMLSAGVLVWALVGKFSFPRGIQSEDDISILRRRLLGISFLAGAALVIAGAWAALA